MKKGGNNSRKRDQGRSYKSGSQKRKAKKNEQKMISELPKITMLLGNKCHDQQVTTEEIGKHRSETETEESINELPEFFSMAMVSDDEQEEPRYFDGDGE